MTTIAWDGKCLAADSQFGGQFIEQAPIEKIVHLANGCVVAGAGTMTDVRRIAAWVEEGAERAKYPSLDDCSETFVIDERGISWFGPGSGGIPLPLPAPTAIGSGGSFAVAAMLAGATAAQAVEIACRLDAESSLPVQTWERPP